MTRRLLGLFALLAAVGILTRASLMGVRVVDVDEAVHLVGSWRLMAGGRLYVDFVDNKPPLLYLHYAVAQWLLGRGLVPVRLFTDLVTVPLAALGISAFLGHARRGLLGALIFLAWSAAYLGHDMLAVNCELLLVMPAAWALVMVRDEERAARAGQALAFGVLLGVASLFKQVAAAWLPAPALALAMVRVRTDRRVPVRQVALALGAAAVGFALPWLVALAFFARSGDTGWFLYWNLTHNLAYAANPISAAEAAARVVKQGVPFLLVTAPLWWAALRGRHALGGYRSALVAVLLALCAPMVFAGWRMFPHYFIPLYVPLALGAAPWLDHAWRAEGRAWRWAVGWTVVLVIGFAAANRILYSGGAEVYEETSPLYDEVARQLRADPCAPGATLFVWGSAPEFYVATGMTPASRFVVPQASLSGYVPGNRGSVDHPEATKSLVLPEHWDLLMGDLERTHATFILDTAASGLHHWDRYPVRDFPRLANLVRRQYEVVAVVDGVVVNRRLGCQPQ